MHGYWEILLLFKKKKHSVTVDLINKTVSKLHRHCFLFMRLLYIKSGSIRYNRCGDTIINIFSNNYISFSQYVFMKNLLHTLLYFCTNVLLFFALLNHRKILIVSNKKKECKNNFKFYILEYLYLNTQTKSYVKAY